MKIVQYATIKIINVQTKNKYMKLFETLTQENIHVHDIEEVQR